MAFATASYCRSWPRLDAGRIPEAIADAERAIDARRYGWKQFLPAAYAVAALARLERGELDDARAAIAAVPAHEWDQTPPWTAILHARGALAMAEGRHADAREDFLAWGAMMPGMNPAMYSEWRSAAGLAMARLDARQEAMELIGAELELVRRFGAPPAIGVTLTALGVVEGGDSGLRRLEEAVAILATTQVRLPYWRALVELGAALRRRNKRAAARELLHAAMEQAELNGASVIAGRARAEFLAAGGRPRRERSIGIGALTPGEQRVAELVAQGMTNREIAESQFVTVKAVEWHLRQIYAKLAATTREELIAELRERLITGEGKRQVHTD